MFHVAVDPSTHLVHVPTMRDHGGYGVLSVHDGAGNWLRDITADSNASDVAVNSTAQRAYVQSSGGLYSGGSTQFVGSSELMTAVTDGTVTLPFTQLEGSTRLYDGHSCSGDALRAETR
jgi:hypothetical protein